MHCCQKDLGRTGRSKKKFSYHVLRKLSRVAASAWASNFRHWEELLDSNPDKPQWCEPSYFQKIGDCKKKVNYPFDILGILFVVGNIAFDHLALDNLLKSSSIHGDGLEAHEPVIRRLDRAGRPKEPTRQLKRLP